MARGFGNVPSSNPPGSRKSKSPKGRSKQTAPQNHEIEVEEEISGFWEEDQPEDLDHDILAWEAGLYNPIEESAAAKARPLNPDEKKWLSLAKDAGWLEVDDALDAIYFTAPPPNFDPDQADWYVRPDMTNWLEEPELLREAITKYPIPAH